MLRRILCLWATSLFCAVSAVANPYSDMVRAEIMPGWRMADGTLMAGLRLRLEPGWKTYWRAPGDAGIPPSFNWSKSRNVDAVDVTFPMPELFVLNGLRTLGYSREVVLPLAVTPATKGKPVRLTGKIELGICSDVCVPLHLTLRQRLTGQSTTPEPAIAAALAERPFSAREAGVGPVTCGLKPNDHGLTLTAEIPITHSKGREMVVVEPGDPMVWASESRVSRHGGTLVAETDLIHATADSFALDRSNIRFTVFGRNQAVDIVGCGG